MKLKSPLFILISIMSLLVSGYSMSAQEEIYGSQLMTEQERMEHREKMRSMKTEQEREQYRIEHHKRMQQRAKEQGLNLPDSPRQSQGQGQGMGGGGRGR